MPPEGVTVEPLKHWSDGTVQFDISADRNVVLISNTARPSRGGNVEYCVIPLSTLRHFAETLIAIPELKDRIHELANEKADLLARLQSLVRYAEALQMRTPHDLTDVHAFLDEVQR